MVCGTVRSVRAQQRSMRPKHGNGRTLHIQSFRWHAAVHIMFFVDGGGGSQKPYE